MDQQNEELQNLVSQGITLWGRSQETLEKQALKELEIFVEESHENKATDRILSQLEIKHGKDEQINNNQFVANISSGNENKSNLENDGCSIIEHPTYNGHTDGSESDYIPSAGELSDEDYEPFSVKNRTSKKPIKRKSQDKTCQFKKSKIKDDALESNYKARLNEYYNKVENDLERIQNEDDLEEINGYKKIKGGFKVPKTLWNKLYEYQKDAVKWLWGLHQKPSGGILGDEMGLGKTVQIIVFLHALQFSKIISKHGKFVGVGPTIIVCPATVINQWVTHFHEWSPEFRVAILHQSGTYQGNKIKLINEINKSKGIIVTTYASILKYKGNLCDYNWHYLILDEGHKIRNPLTKITLAVKEIRTPHRIMLTGSPMQNNLSELWSLFDFTNPGMLGSLATFTEHFVNPIVQGGFANSSPMQEATALSVASTLKNVITPFLLRRMKSEVKNDIQLPHKSEQVLFCALTKEQRDLYLSYLMSEHVNAILNRGVRLWRSDNAIKANMLIAITALRKICNHPDLHMLQSPDCDETNIDNNIGYYKRSGKMVVVSALLKIWKKQGHKTLLFSQGRSMIRIFESFLSNFGYRYLKMDGTTSISSRQSLIDKFNQSDDYDVFLLTTRVGGLGVNLTGASRVIIYDPDWNPATDSQARERAWRIGQNKSVTVYRLISAGTVEEKMYQRQVWKQLLSNKVLVDPSTNKFFKSSDLFDLFSLPDSTETNPETTNIFRESRVKIQEKIKEKKPRKRKPKSGEAEDADQAVQFSQDKIEQMKALAQRIARNMSGESDKGKGEVKKTYVQIELEKERQEKLKEKQKLKSLSAPELIEYNRLKARPKIEEESNKLDDNTTNISFDKALEHSSKTASLYHHKLQNKIPPVNCSSSSGQIKEEITETQQTCNKRKHKESVDTSGRIDGEDVEGLVKREKKKLKTEKSVTNDNFILEHLFSKKGVAGALEHESVLNGSKKPSSLKDRTQADEKAQKALDALKKSRLNSWRW
ncbi:DNA excision repair protein ERCC-6-like isoform X1 [Rhynchophorus ferrugineus]|uniref:DNA excision repair protein ERCC-6-like isoform X1 n=1 Tax=Rhynchophorus ferrugineus TaxID=354439 RepID=UPI003FCDCB2B